MENYPLSRDILHVLSFIEGCFDKMFDILRVNTLNPYLFTIALTAVRIVYFLSFFSPFAEKTLTNFNIQGTCFGNYKGHASSENTPNFSFSPNIFSDSPSNFTDFPAIFGIKIVEIPRFAEVSPLLYYKDTKFSGEMQIR